MLGLLFLQERNHIFRDESLSRTCTIDANKLPWKAPLWQRPIHLCQPETWGVTREFLLGTATEQILMASGDVEAQGVHFLCATQLSAFSQASCHEDCLLMLLDLCQLFQAFFASLCFSWQHRDAHNCVSVYSKILLFAAGPQKYTWILNLG